MKIILWSGYWRHETSSITQPLIQLSSHHQVNRSRAPVEVPPPPDHSPAKHSLVNINSPPCCIVYHQSFGNSSVHVQLKANFYFTFSDIHLVYSKSFLFICIIYYLLFCIILCFESLSVPSTDSSAPGSSERLETSSISIS